MFATRSHDFGTVARDAKAEFEFVFKNKYVPDVRVAGTRVSCSCISTRVRNPHLKTYQEGAVVAKLNTAAYRGPRRVTITVTFDRPYRATVQLQVKGYIRGDVVFQPSGIDFGEVDQGAAVEKTIQVSRSGRSSWRVLNVKSSNPHISGEVVGTRTGSTRVTCDVRVRLDAAAPVGYLRDHVTLVTNDSRREEIPVRVDGRVCPAIVASPSSLFLGPIRPGQSLTRQLVVRSKTPFRVLSVTGQQGAVQARLADHDAARPIHVIPVTFTAGDATGKVLEVISIETDADDDVIEVMLHAVVRP
jgi:hypothetical protein